MGTSHTVSGNTNCVTYCKKTPSRAAAKFRWILEIHKQHGDSGTATATFDDLLLYG